MRKKPKTNEHQHVHARPEKIIKYSMSILGRSGQQHNKDNYVVMAGPQTEQIVLLERGKFYQTTVFIC